MTHAVSQKNAWYILILFVLLGVLSFVDRYILVLVIDPVGRDLGVTDAKLSILIGAGFAVIYSLAALPIAQWIDRRERRLAVTAGVLLWSIMTALSGTATSYEMLALCRMGVAIGEATLTPAAISIIADIFPPNKRALPVAVFAAVAGVMSSGAFMLGAASLQVGELIAASTGAAPWRMTLMFLGAIGIVLALVFFITVREPTRDPSQTLGDTQGAQGNEILAYLKSQWRLYLPLYAGIAVISCYLFAMLAWTPTLLIRSFGITPASAGYLFGIVGLPFTLLGTFFWSWAATHRERRGDRAGPVTVLVIGAVLATPFMIAGPLLSTALLVALGLALAKFSFATVSVMPPRSFQTYAPARVRGRLTAINLLAINLVGFSLGPPLAVLVGSVVSGTDSIAWGLAGLGFCVGPISILLFYFAFRTLRKMPPMADPRSSVSSHD